MVSQTADLAKYADVTVVTPSIPGREGFLAEAMASVRGQTVAPVRHLVSVAGGSNTVEQLNLLCEPVRTEWIAVLADDNLWLPEHLEKLTSKARLWKPDVTYSYARGLGGVWPHNRTFDAEALRRQNFIDANSLIRTEALRKAGGWPAEPRFAEDWGLWLRILDQGGTFACVPTVTWVYRYHGANQSMR